MSPARKASTNCRTRAFSETTWRAIGSSATCAGAASRSAGNTESRGRRFARGAPVGVRAGGEPARQAAVHDDDRDRTRQRRPVTTVAVRQSSSSACSARPNTDAIWSMTPHGTPDARCSASWAASASLAGRRARSPRRAQPRARSRLRTPRSTRVPSRSAPSTRPPHRSRPPVARARASAATTASTRARRPRRARREVDRVDDDPIVGAGAERDEHVAIDRERQAQPVLVVGVVADQVDPARRPHERDVASEPAPEQVGPRGPSRWRQYAPIAFRLASAEETTWERCNARSLWPRPPGPCCARTRSSPSSRSCRSRRGS